jgi:hypothetical protein
MIQKGREMNFKRKHRKQRFVSPFNCSYCREGQLQADSHWLHL